MKNKKAITPLISTIILLLFAVFLGFFVMNFGKNITSNINTCNFLNIDITTYNNEKQICFNEEKIYFTLDNLGEGFDGLKLTLYGENDVSNILINQSLSYGNSERFSISYDNSIGKIKKVTIIPFIVTNNKNRLCFGSKIDIENIKEC